MGQGNSNNNTVRKTLAYGLQQGVTNNYLNDLVVAVVTDFYDNKTNNPEYYRNVLGPVFWDKTADEQDRLMNVSVDLLISIITSKLSRGLNEVPDANVITPWEVQIAIEKSNLTSLFGPTRTTLPIIVRINSEDKEYKHELTEDIVFGILIVLHGAENKNIELYVTDDRIPDFRGLLSIWDIGANYRLQNTYKQYMAGSSFGDITFDGSEVIRGVVTAASWLNDNPHKYIRNITDMTNGEAKITF